MEKDIRNYLPTVIFRGTPCMILHTENGIFGNLIFTVGNINLGRGGGKVHQIVDIVPSPNLACFKEHEYYPTPELVDILDIYPTPASGYIRYLPAVNMNIILPLS